MSDERQDSERERVNRLQQTFDEAARDLDLRLEPAGAVDPRCIGVAFIILPVVSYDLEDSPPPAGHHDDEQIKELIHSLESLSLPQYQNGAWHNYVNDPHVAVTVEGVGKVDQAAVDGWLASPQFQEYQQEYPPKTPREVRIHNVQIVYIGSQLASASYRVVESFANGKVNGGNSTVILGRLEGAGWRVVVVTKGGREDLHPSPHE